MRPLICKFGLKKKELKCTMKAVEDTKKGNLIREIQHAKQELSDAETNYAWADTNYIDSAIARVTMARERYYSLVREYRSNYGK